VRVPTEDRRRDPPAGTLPVQDHPPGDFGNDAPGPTSGRPPARGIRAAQVLLVTAIFVVPVIFDPRTNDVFNLIKIASLWVFVVLATGAWLLSALISGHRLIPRSRIVSLSLLLLGVTAVSTLLSPNRTLSFHGLYHRYEGLASIGLYVGMLIVLVAVYRRRPEGLSEIAVAVGAAAGTVGGYVVIQWLGLDPFQWQEMSGREPTFPIGNLGNSSFTASFLGISAPFVAYLVMSSRTLVLRLLWGGVALLVVGGLLFTQGRAGILAATAGAGALLLFTSRLRALVKLSAVGVVLIALVSITPFVAGDPTDEDEVGLFSSRSASYRTESWKASVDMTVARPLLGWGPESFYGQYGQYRTLNDARWLGLVLTDKPHNVFLGWSTATGLIGLGVYMFLLWTALHSVAAITINERARRRLVATFGAGLVAYLVQGMYGIDVPPLAFMGWVALAGIGATATWGRQKEDAAPDPNQRTGRSGKRPWVLAAPVAGLSLLMAGLGFGPLRADYEIRTAQDHASLHWSAGVMNSYQRAISLNPREATYRSLAGSYLESVSDDPGAPFSRAMALERAANFFEEAVALQPRNVHFMIGAARVYAELGPGDERFFSDAEAWLAKVVDIDPRNPQARSRYAVLLQQWSESTDDPGLSDELRERSAAQTAIAQGLREGRDIR
jgi:O-antigen ligase